MDGPKIKFEFSGKKCTSSVFYIKCVKIHSEHDWKDWKDVPLSRNQINALVRKAVCCMCRYY